MKNVLIFFLILTSLSACRNKNVKAVPCNSLKYDSTLISFIASFNPSSLKLASSIKENRELNIFLDTVNWDCLENQTRIREFVASILIKQYYFHLSHYNQGYDLLQMDSGNAKIIIDSFKKMSGQETETEMLNSSFIIEYLESHPKIDNQYIREYRDKISLEIRAAK